MERIRKPGAGRKKSVTGYVKSNINITPDAAKILASLPFGEKSKFVSEAIINYKK